MRNRAIVITGGLLGALIFSAESTATFAASVDAELERCAAVDDVDERLRCFDALVIRTQAKRWLADSFRTIADSYDDAARLMEGGDLDGSVEALQQAEVAIQLLAALGGDSKIKTLEPSVRQVVNDILRADIMAERELLLQCAEALNFRCVIDQSGAIAEQFLHLEQVLDRTD